jgi:hypothetical protein
MGWVMSGRVKGREEEKKRRREKRSVKKERKKEERKRTIVRHGKNGNLGDGSVSALDTTGSLVDGGKIGVHVS